LSLVGTKIAATVATAGNGNKVRFSVWAQAL
jgi:hypothetical protein